MKIISVRTAATVLAIASMVPMAAFAQTAVGSSVTAVGNAAQMPVFYSSSGSVVNNGNSAPLPAGYYYLAPGSQHQIYYYGNGTYYDPSTGEYGGSVTNPNGTAGANLGYMTNNNTVAQSSNTGTYNPTTGTTGMTGSTTGTGSSTGTTGAGTGTSGTTSVTPGVPNTGAGGDALATWMTLAVSAVAMALGIGYLATSRKNALD